MDQFSLYVLKGNELKKSRKDRIKVSYRKTGESEHPSERENEGCSSDTQTKDKPRSSTQGYEGPGAQESHSPSPPGTPGTDAPSRDTPSVANAPKGSGKRKKASRKSPSKEYRTFFN